MEQVNERGCEKPYQASGGGKLKYKPKKCIPKSYLPTASQGTRLHPEKLEVGQGKHRPKTPPDASSVDEGIDRDGWNSWIGKWVGIGGVKQGILRYYGPTQFADGYWCGVELSEAVGKNNGTVAGIQYFDCRDNFGIFAPVSKVQKLLTAPETVMELANEQSVIEQCSQSRSKSKECPKNSQSCTSIPVSSKMCQSLSETKIAESKIPAPKFTLMRSSRSMTIASEVPSALPSLNSPQLTPNFKSERSSTVSEGCTVPKGRLKQINETSLVFDQMRKYRNAHDQDASENVQFSDPLNRTFDVRLTPADDKSPSDVYNKTFNMHSPSVRNATFTLESPICELAGKDSTFLIAQQAKSSQAALPEEGKLSYDGDINRTFACDSLPKRDSLTLLEHIIHSASGKQEEYDDDQQSLELDDSLGILTPSQMKDFTGCFDHQIATMEFEVASIPKTMSCDDVNDIPEFEEVQDITVEYLSENSKQCYCFKSDKNLHTYLESFSPEVSKVLVHQHSCDILNSPSLEELNSKHPLSDAIKTSTPTNTDKNCHVGAINNDLCKLVDGAWAAVNVNNEKQIQDRLNTLQDASSMAKDNLDLKESLCRSNNKDDLEYFADKIKDQAPMTCGKKTATTDCKNDETKNCITDDLASICTKSLDGPHNDSAACIDVAMHLDFSLNETFTAGVENDLLSQKPTSAGSVELQENMASRTQIPDSLVQSIGLDSQGDESELQRLVGNDDCRMTDVVHEKERPVSVYTVGSTDTGFQGDEEMDIQSEVESVAVGSAEVDPNRISTYSADSCIVSEGTGAYPKSDIASDWELDVEVCDGFAELESSAGFSGIKHGRHVHRSTESVCSARPGDITPLSESCKPLEVTREDIRRMEQDKGISNVAILEEYPACSEIEKNVSVDTLEFTKTFSETLCSELKFVEKSIQVCDLDVKLPGIDKSAQTQDLCLSPELKTPEKLHHLVSKKLEPKSAPPKITRKVESDHSTTGSRFKKPGMESTSKKVPLPPPPPKPPKKNVMSKIKAMIEATSCRSVGKVEEVKPKVTRPPKKSRWEAVTSKIAQSLAEEKVKPKTMKEIRSRVDTNLTGARQVGTGTRSGSSRNNSVIDNEGSIVSGPITPTSKNVKNLLHSQREFDVLSGQVITDDFDPEQLPWESSTKQESNSLQNETVITREPKPLERHRSRSPRHGITPRSGSPIAPTDVSNNSFASLTSHASKSTKLPPNRQSGPASQVETVKKDIQIAPVKKPLSARPSSIAPSTRRTLATNKPDSKPRSLALAGRLNAETDGKKLNATSPSKAELNRLNQEIQHLGALCETRTKELNLLKMQLKHTTLGFNAFASLIKYLTEELDSFSHPRVVEELQKTREELTETENKLKLCEEELEKIKEYHATEIGELNEKLSLVREEEITQLHAKHATDLEELKTLHQQELSQATECHEKSLKETEEKHALEIEKLNAEYNKMKEDIVEEHAKQLEAATLCHEETKTTLNSQISNLRKQYEELQKQTKQFEEALQKDTNEKIQWISAKKADLQKEVDSLKTVLEMKRNEIHSLRTENAELKKELEELPLAREKIKMLKARAEDLQALVNQKVRVQRQLSSEHQHLKESYEKESRNNMRLSMEKEELEWKLKQNMEASILLTSIAGPELLEKLAKEQQHATAPSSLRFPNADLSSIFSDSSLNFGDSFETTSPASLGQQLPKKSPLRSPVTLSSSTPCSPQLKNTRRKRTTSKSEVTTPGIERKDKLEPYYISQDILQSVIANAVELATNNKQLQNSKIDKTPSEANAENSTDKCDNLDFLLDFDEGSDSNNVFSKKIHESDINPDDVDIQVENECLEANQDAVLNDMIRESIEDNVTKVSVQGESSLQAIKLSTTEEVTNGASKLAKRKCSEAGDAEAKLNDKGLVIEPVFSEACSGDAGQKSEMCDFFDSPKVFQISTPESVKTLVVGSSEQTKVLLSVSQPPSQVAAEDSSSSMQSSMTSSSDSSSWSAGLPTSPHHISCEASNASLSSEDPSLCSSNGSSRNAVERRDDDQFYSNFPECATGGSTPDDGSQRRLHFENITVCHYRVASPRSLAGEAMVQDSTSPSFSQFTSEDSSGYRCDRQTACVNVDEEFSEQPGSRPGVSEAPSTLPPFDPPSLEASSQGIVLTDSTNIDGSWCEEELPSESEA